MNHGNIGKQVFKVGGVLTKRQNQFIAAGFVLAALIWIGSWILDYRDKGSLEALFSSGKGAFTLTGKWLRDEVVSRLVDFSSIIAIIAGYLTVTGKHYDNLRARFLLKGHVIVCGMSSRSQILARDLVANGTDVVIIDASERNETAHQREAGICVITGNATTPEVLKAAGFARAARLICLTDRDETNCAIVETCRTLLEEPGSEATGEITIHCHIRNQGLQTQLAAMDLFTRGVPAANGRRGGRFRLLCVEDSAAWQILTSYPPERHLPREAHATQVNVVVFGASPVGQALLLRMAETCHYWGPPSSDDSAQARLKVTLIDPRAAVVWNRMRGLMPSLDTLLDVSVVNAEFDDAAALAGIDACFRELPPSQIYVSLGDAVGTMSFSVMLLRRFGESIDGDAAVLAILPPQLPRIATERWISDTRLATYDLYAACTQEAMLGVEQDRLAIAIHDRYFESQIAAGACEGLPDDGTALHPWERLNEWYRESNRSQAAHIGVKLRTTGHELLPPGSEADGAEWPLATEEVERLAEMEHRRWMAFHLLSGWKYGPRRDNARRIHPSLQPYHRLSEPEREKDRDTVLKLAEQLRSLGYRIRKTATGDKR